MNQRKKQKIGSARQILPLVFGVALGTFAARHLDRLSDSLGASQALLLYLAFFLCLFASSLLHVAIHESGHLLTGKLLGFRFRSFRLYSFIWIKDNGKLKFRRYKLAGTGGQCIMFPPKDGVSTGALVLHHMGGVILDAISCTLLLLVAFCLCPDPYVRFFLLIPGALTFLSLISNGIPMRAGLVINDGHNALSIARSPAAKEAYLLQMAMVEQESLGVTYKDMPAHWFTVPSDEAMKDSMVATLAVACCGRLMEQRLFDDADRLMEHLLEIDSGLIGLHRVLLTAERVYLELMRQNRPEVVQQLLTPEQKKLMKNLGKNLQILRTEYALARLLEWNEPKAQSLKARFESVAQVYPYRDEVAEERSLMELTDQRATFVASLFRRS
ncbi:MAG: hypothetical protein J6K89_07400 [Oscillospiraceae bacterium]|nr:hypothetical protein [Oscillospiraceae bacterium]